MNRYIAVCDSETEYVCGLMEYLNSCGRLPYEIRAFTGRENLLELAEPGDCTLLIIAQSEYAEEVRDRAYSPVLLLGEGGPQVQEDVPVISKYQSAAQIAGKAAALCLEEADEPPASLRHGKPVKIIGLYTPVTRCLQTTLALTLGQLLAETEPAVYMNFEAWPGLEYLLGRQFQGGVGDLLYFNACARPKTAGRLKLLAEDVGGLHVLPPITSFEELHSITGTQWLDLISTVRELTEYQWLILDLTEQISGLVDILRCCDRIYMITREDGFSQARQLQFVQLLRTQGCEDISVKLRRLQLPFFSRLPASICDLRQGELAEYARGLLREDEIYGEKSC